MNREDLVLASDRIRNEEIEPESLRQVAGTSWAFTLFPARSSLGANAPIAPLPGRYRDDAAADAALAGQANQNSPWPEVS